MTKRVLTWYSLIAIHYKRCKRTNQSTMSTGKSRADLNHEARVNLATAYRACHYYDLNQGIFADFTQRAPAKDGEGDIMLVIPYGLLWTEVTASCLIGVDFETGKVVEGEGKVVHTVNNIHRAIHQTRYPIDGITSVMHTHQRYTTALACLDDPEPFKFGLTHASMYYLDKIAYDYGFTGDQDGEGYRLAEALGNKHVLMMANHGVLAVAKSAADAFGLLYFLEEAAKTQVSAQSTGKKLLLASLEVTKKMSPTTVDGDEDLALLFDAMKRKFSNEKPSVMD